GRVKRTNFSPPVTFTLSYIPPDMAQRPVVSTSRDQKPKFAELNNLISEKLGGRVLFTTDDWFAVAENMLKENEAEWKEGEFTECGKWMDGWETRRKRKPGHDWCIIKLGVAGVVAGVDVDTSHFTGNYVPQVSLQAAVLTPAEEALIPERQSVMGNEASDHDLQQVARLHSEQWVMEVCVWGIAMPTMVTLVTFSALAEPLPWPTDGRRHGG
ncbi:hypothetical protein OTU49_007379, partial [Cherax quadricarinatus]